jgi:hypothetical protein
MRRTYQLKKLFLFAVLLMAGWVTQAQLYQVVPNLNLQTSTVGTFPCADLRWARTVFLLRPADMAAAGVPANKTFNYLNLRQTVASATPGITGTVTIWLQNTTDVVNTKSTTWATAISSMTQVTASAFTFPTTANYYTIPFSNFTYSTGGMYVAIEYSNPAGTLGLANSSSVNNALTGLALRSQTTAAVPGATVAATGFRPELQMGFQFNNDANVAQVYTLGKMPIEYGAPTIIQAAVTNSGVNPLTNVPVTMSITGTNTFGDVQTIASLAPGQTSVVSFTSYSPSALSTNDVVTVTVPTDDNPLNDSRTWNMNITQNVYTYKNASLPNNGGVGFNGGTGDFVAKFNSNIGQTFPYNLSNPYINEIKADFAAGGQPYTLAIWAADGAGGIPGTLLWESAQQTSAVGTAVIGVSPVVQVVGDYYVGVRQLGLTNVSFAYQTENPIRQGTFYYAAPTGQGNWTDFNATNSAFRFSIEVTVELPIAPNCAENLLPADNTMTPCSNPTLTWSSGGGAPTGYDVYFSTNMTDVQSLAPAALVSANQAGTSYVPTTLANTQYYWAVVPKNLFGDATSCGFQTFTTGVLTNCYCLPVHGTQCTGIITNVSLGTINNTTTCAAPGYNSYPASGSTTTQITQNTPTTLSVTTDQSEIISVWIDYNHDGNFDASEWNQVTLASTANTPATFSLVIPGSSLTGLTLMRIRTRFAGNVNGATDPCTSFGSGESEDYVIDILPEPPCSGTPTPGQTIASISNYCLNLNSLVNFSLQNSTTGTGVTYQWETADDVNFTTNVIALGTASTQAYNMVGGSKYFRCQVTCSGNTGISTPVLVSENPYTQCYCASSAQFSDDEEIVNVTVGSGSTQAAYAGLTNACLTVAPGSGSVLSGYSNFTTLAPITTVNQGSTIPFTVEQDECDNAPYFAAGIGVWIDYNQDGDFNDAGEDVYIEPTAVSSPRILTGSFVVPGTATVGTTRMRIICAESFAGATLTPCLSYGYGETEDYLIDIAPPANATLNLKFFIEGFYTGAGTMAPVLNNSGFANPLTDCDNVTVELHDATSPFATAYTFTGVLQTDGTLSCTFPGAAVGNSYYIGILTRNAIQTASDNPVLLGSVTSYDFTTADTQAEGANQKQVEPGVWAFWSGDIDQDFAIDGLDYVLQDPDVIAGSFGYLATDLNGDGLVDAFDYLLLDPNIIAGITALLPY